MVAGCSAEEIARVEAVLGLRLPPAYRGFLAVMGKAAGPLYLGDTFLYPTEIDVREDAALLAERHGWTLPEDAVVFAMHGGWEFDFIRASEGDDPPVYHYVEGEPGPLRVCDHFTECISRAVEEQRERGWR
ncbi:MAG: SMI1/KNR4 family protein [Armatimonadota bacterium]